MEKLVRDRIPVIMSRNDGKMPSVRFPKDDTEALKFLILKLEEEVQELKGALLYLNLCAHGGASEKVAAAEAVEEAADVVEVLLALFPSEALSKAVKSKHSERGGFSALAIVDFPE